MLGHAIPTTPRRGSCTATLRLHATVSGGKGCIWVRCNRVRAAPRPPHLIHALSYYPVGPSGVDN